MFILKILTSPSKTIKGELVFEYTSGLRILL